MEGGRSSARSAFAALASGFAEAAARAGSIVHDIDISGRRVSIRFAGAALPEYFVPAFAHLAAANERPPELTINVWDSHSSGVPLPEGVGSLEEHYAAAMPTGTPEDGVFRAYLRPNPGLSMFDAAASVAYYWIPDAARTPYDDRSGPFRAILNWWLTPIGEQFVHAAAVGTTGEGAVLIVGKGGSGKSTTALACLLDGMAYVGDDYNLLSMDKGPWVGSLYATAKLHAHNIVRLPALGPLVANPGRHSDEKAVLLLHDHFAEQLCKGLPVRAVLVPRVTGLVETSIHPVSAARGLAALAPSTLLQLSATRDTSMRAMAQLVRAVPNYQIDLGTDISAIPKAIRGLLTELSK